MLLAVLGFTHLLQSCAPNIGPRTMTAIVHVESGGNRLAVRDNTLNRAFYPKTMIEAVRLAKYLLGKHHNLDLGISQLNSANLPGLGMSVLQTFNPCDNLRGGAAILAGDYRRAVAKFGPGQYALRRAIGAYNTGSLFAGNMYISMILDAAGIQDRPTITARVPNLTAMSGSATGMQAGEQALPRVATQAPITAASVVIRPENSPILVRWSDKKKTPVLASGGQEMTHIPLTVPAQDQDMMPQAAPGQSDAASADAASADAPIILQALPVGTAQTITPQQLLQSAAAQRRSR